MPPSRPFTILAFDYGLRRIGVAIGQSDATTSGPLMTVSVSSSGPDWTAIDSQLKEWQPSQLLVGLPYNMDGTDNELTACARQFAKQLKDRFGLPVDTVDERLTSLEARDVLRGQRQQGIRRKRVQNEDIDQVSALLILQTWLNEQKGNAEQ